MKNILGVKLPEYIDGYGTILPFEGAKNGGFIKGRRSTAPACVLPGEKKVYYDLEGLFNTLNIKDGMTISFHHHLRNGDFVLNMVMREIERRGIKNLTIAASSIFPVHAPLVELIEKGVVTRIYSDYISGPVGRAISKGKLKHPAVMQSHGGRARAIESGDLKIDIAFVAAPTCDTYGNINGVEGKSACGALGYAVSDCEYADKVVAITDNLVDYPVYPIEIPQHYIDYVLAIESIGDPKGIVSGTTQITKDPIGLMVAKNAAKFIKESGLLKDGMSFQTGAGGISLAVAKEVKEMMEDGEIEGSFASGGITGYIVDMLEEGLFKSLFDVQCFDLKAIESYKNNINHQGMSASLYGNPHNKGPVVNNLDVVILGATEIDTKFNVNVTTGSDGVIMGGSGGHCDTAAGAKLTIIVSNLMKARLPIIKDKVTTITTPGESIDVLVTERGIAINPQRRDLVEKFKDSKLPIKTIEELKEIAESFTGKPEEIQFDDKIVALIEYRDGTIIDIVKKVKE
ncbi:citrate lyase subunit alpha [Clostridium fallax]|uniref:Citrate lyase alpha chain n=1 Tax=Clostridium fallax TaxID=1533 RepID=A0A1M4TT10_9CLOT|nr:citrate lyase subunit alpha [Clostridium fallax]SHE47640.1 citrate lyase subunit alpha / citrate CoA-transferase [Clostridium fallax]SQB22409.1 citrate lyase alpha chain [Clostridium fallax]